MPYTVEFLRTALRELASVPKSRQVNIAKHIDALQTDPLPHGVQQLRGVDEKFYRIRAGDFRVVYQVDHEKRLVTIIRLGHRSDVYRGR